MNNAILQSDLPERLYYIDFQAAERGKFTVDWSEAYFFIQLCI